MPAKYFIRLLLIPLFLWSFVNLSHAMAKNVLQDADAQKYFDEGMNSYKKGEYEKAVEVFKEVIKLKPDYDIAYESLGLIYGNLGQYEEAIEIYKELQKIRPDDANIYRMLGFAYMGLENWGKASEAFKKAIKLYPDDAKTHYNLGLAYSLMHKTEQAIEAYREGIRLDPNNADAHAGLGHCFLLLEKYEQSINECSIAFRIDKNNTSCYLTLGLSYFNLRQYEKAIEPFEKALILNPNSAEVYTELGRSLGMVNKYEQAVEVFKRAIKINPDYGDAHYHLAITYSLLNDVTASLEHAKTALDIYKKLLDKEGEANVLLEIARTNLQQGKDINAMINLQKALTLYHEIGNLRGEGDTLSAISSVYSLLQEYGAALDYLNKALLIYQQLGDTTSIIISQLEIANINFSLVNKSSKDYDELIKYANQILDIAEKSKINKYDLDLIGFVHLLLGRAYIETHDYDNAKKYAAKIMKIAEENNDRHLISYAFLLTGEIFDQISHYSQALDYYLKSINILDNNGSIHWRIGHIYNKLGDFNKAKNSYIKAIDIIEEKREKTQSLTARMSLAINAIEVYTDTILFFLKTNEHDETFNYMERAKARTFLDLLGTKFKLQDKEIFEEERRLQFRINYLSEKIREVNERPDKKVSPQMKLLLEKQLNEARTEYTALLEKIKKENPELSTLLTVNPLTLKQVQELLDSDTTLLEYFITPDKTLLWVVSKSDLNVIEIPIKDKELKEKVNAFRAKIANLNPDYNKDADELYNLLIRPAKPHIKTKRIGIVPHSILHYLPFHALLNKDKFLIEEYEMFYTPSASVLKFVYEKRKEVKGKVLAFGNPDIGDESLNLPYAEDEVKKIKNTYPDTALYLKEKATEDKAKTLSANYNIIHFASHGELNPTNPMFSSIRLAKDKDEDGRLEVNEIFNLNLKNTSLVTLSACETGLGKLTQGDELVGLTRGFIYAGTPSIVASLWKVNDQSTSEIMSLFYKNLKSYPKSESLRMAQLEMIRGKTGKGIVRGVGGITTSKEGKPKQESSMTVDGSHPYFWAPFILLGDWK